MVIGMHHIMLSSLVLASSAGDPASVEPQNVPPQASPSTGPAEAPESRARPHILTVEVQQEERGHFVITVRFRRLESGVPGELRIDLWNGDERRIVQEGFASRQYRHGRSLETTSI